MRYFCNALMWHQRRKVAEGANIIAPFHRPSSCLHLPTPSLIWVAGLGFTLGWDKDKLADYGLYTLTTQPSPNSGEGSREHCCPGRTILGWEHLGALGSTCWRRCSSWRPWCPLVIGGSQVLGPRTGYPLLQPPPT